MSIHKSCFVQSSFAVFVAQKEKCVFGDNLQFFIKLKILYRRLICSRGLLVPNLLNGDVDILFVRPVWTCRKRWNDFPSNSVTKKSLFINYAWHAHPVSLWQLCGYRRTEWWWGTWGWDRSENRQEVTKASDYLYIYIHIYMNQCRILAGYNYFGSFWGSSVCTALATVSISGHAPSAGA